MRGTHEEEGDDAAVKNNNRVPSLSPEKIHSVDEAAGLPGVFLTLSDALVQFLSSLQLQGYASRLIDSCGMYRMEELAARVTCEDDVVQLLGARSSLQQRHELWRGICRWKQLARKRMREQAKRPRKQRVEDSGTLVEAAISLGTTREETVRFAASDECTPSQFMRQFAFHGYKDSGMTATDKRSKEQQLSTVRCFSVPAVVPEAFAGQTCGTSGCERSEIDVVSTPTTPKRRSASWSSSVSPWCVSQLYSAKRCRHEKLPLASLSVGPAAHPVEADEFADLWCLPSGDAVPSQDSSGSVIAPPPPQEEQQESDVSVGRTFEEFRAEHERLREEMRMSIESAVLAYNEGLRTLQEKVFLASASTQTNGSCGTRGPASCEAALALGREPQLRVEMHPVGLHEAVVVAAAAATTTTATTATASGGVQRLVISQCKEVSSVIPANDGSSHECDPRPSLANATVVSPPSDTVAEDEGKLSAQEVLPSLSCMTTPGSGGSHRCRGVPAFRDDMPLASTPSHKSTRLVSPTCKDKHDPSIPTTPLFDVDAVLSFPSIHQDGSVIEISAETRCGSGDVPHDEVGERETRVCHTSAVSVRTTTTYPSQSPLPPQLSCAIDNGNETHPGIARPSGMFSLEQFGLQALHQGGVNEAVSPFWDPMLNDSVLVGKGGPQAAAGCEVIDVDALSSSDSDLRGANTTVLLDCDDHVDATIAHRSTECATQRSNLMGMSVFSSQDDHAEVYTHLPLQRQRAVSRAASSSPFAVESTEIDFDDMSLYSGGHATVLDWTAASSMVADVQHVHSRLASGSGHMSSTRNNEYCAEEQTVTTRAVPPRQQPAPLSGLPPLPLKDSPRAALLDSSEDVKTFIERLTPDMVMEMGYEMLRKWCKRLGLHVSRDEMHHADAVTLEEEEEEESNDDGSGMSVHSASSRRNCMNTEGENSSGWWLLDDGSDVSQCTSDDCKGEVTEAMKRRSEAYFDEGRLKEDPRSWRGDERHGATPPTATPAKTTTTLLHDADASEWLEVKRMALTEQMRETLRIFIARRSFMHEVVPSFFHRLPRFSGGPPYKRSRAADLVRTHVVLTQQDLEEQRRLAKAEELEETVCCVITSLAGDAVESIERRALSLMRGKDDAARQRADILLTSIQNGSPLAACGANPPELSVYEQLLLIEPTDVQAAASVVRADFPHISQHRVELLLEESGIPLDTSRRVYNTQRGGVGDTTMTPCSSLSQSPPPSSLPKELERTQQQQQQQPEHTRQVRRRFFAQRGWMQQARRR